VALLLRPSGKANTDRLRPCVQAEPRAGSACRYGSAASGTGPCVGGHAYDGRAAWTGHDCFAVV